jgi:hypothetical protein
VWGARIPLRGRGSQYQHWGYCSVFLPFPKIIKASYGHTAIVEGADRAYPTMVVYGCLLHSNGIWLLLAVWPRLSREIAGCLDRGIQVPALGRRPRACTVPLAEALQIGEGERARPGEGRPSNSMQYSPSGGIFDLLIKIE